MIPPIPTVVQRNEWLNTIFLPTELGKEDEYNDNAISAFENLVGCFFQDRITNPTVLEKYLENIRFDYVGLTSMLKRFQRDAHGVKRFSGIVDKMVADGRFDEATNAEIFKEVCNLGLRITSDSPRKTREAAVFSFWMCVFRPVTFDSENLTGFNPEGLELACAMINFFIAASYLEKIGTVQLGKTQKEIGIRIERIKHDFTFREVSLSTLETFYGAIFTIDPKFLDENGDEKKHVK